MHLIRFGHGPVCFDIENVLNRKPEVYKIEAKWTYRLFKKHGDYISKHLMFST